MRRALLAGAALLAGCATASAQQVVIETPGADVYVAPRAYAPPVSTYEVHGYRSGPRVYEYSRVYDDDDDVVVVQRRYRSGGCGASYYWNGDRCVYIRY